MIVFFTMHSLGDLLHALRDPSVLITAVGMIGIPIIIFIETGLCFPMLPGDSLLVTAGLLASQNDGPVHLNVWVLGVSCSIAAILGNSSGYFIGSRAGRALFAREDSRFFKRAHLLKACAPPAVSPIAKRIRRWTGFRPSATSGSARDLTVETA